MGASVCLGLLHWKYPLADESSSENTKAAVVEKKIRKQHFHALLCLESDSLLMFIPKLLSDSYSKGPCGNLDIGYNDIDIYSNLQNRRI